MDRFTRRKRAKRRKIKKVFKICMILLIVILLAVLGIIQFRQVSILQKEVNDIRSMNVSEDSIDMKLRTDEGFASVEKTIKEYMNEYVTKLKEITSVLEDETFTAMLTEGNIQSDGPYFRNSKAWFREKRELVDSDFERLTELTAPVSVTQAIQDSGISGIYAKLCEHYLTTLQTEFMHTSKEFEDACQQLNEKLDETENILDFLIENKEQWNCESGKLTFETSELMDAYNDLVAESRGSAQ